MAADRCRRVVLAFLDQFILLFVIFPLSVFHWRGTWHLQDVYLVPSNYLISSWWAFAIGSALSTVICLVHPPWLRFLKRRWRWIYVIGIRVYLYVFGWAILCFWRGLWNLVDYYWTDGWVNSTVIYVIAQCISLASRTARTNAGLPLAINLDIDEDLNHPDTRFHKVSVGKWFFVLDVLYSQFVVMMCNVLVWRGLWNILDTFFYPHDALVSSIASLVVGLGTVILFFILAPLLAIGSSRLDSYHLMYKLAYEGLIFVVATWPVLMAWRGMWDLCRDYMIPDKRIGGWVFHIIGVVGLIIMQAFSGVGTNGIDVDGSYEWGEGLFPTAYVAYFCGERKVEVKYNSLPAEMSDLAELETTLMGSRTLPDEDELHTNGHTIDSRKKQPNYVL